MSIFDRIKEILDPEDEGEIVRQSRSIESSAVENSRYVVEDPVGEPIPSGTLNPSLYTIIDTEVSLRDKKVHDIGALRYDGAIYHAADKTEFARFLRGTSFVCGHNIVHHDAKYLFPSVDMPWALVDTLYMSPLLFPERPYHKLVKDDKLQTEELNNPVNDCVKAKDLLMDEIARWNQLPIHQQLIYGSLLMDQPEFVGFLQMVRARYVSRGLSSLIARTFRGKICENADLAQMIKDMPCELAYALALISTTDYRSVTPPWVLRNYPNVENVVRLLRHTRCSEGCEYCNTQLDAHYNLEQIFGYKEFRTYDGDPLQEKAVKAAIAGRSLLAIFPTGGGKSLTFQLPALIEGRTVHGLTVVISPLQSLMKDQVDNLAARGVTAAATINGLLDPISRADAIHRVMSGEASLLYIAPEMLRSKTIERVLLSRHVVRFVIDEAHCFSSWGQDFRVDYLYIGKFIREYQQKKGCGPIPVSCFTATAKQKVVQDICDYFHQTLDVDLKLFASTASRSNLQYSVIHADTDEDKFRKLRSLISDSDCPTIVYVSRTKRTKDLASKLTREGFPALPFNGKMSPDEKVANQEAFMSDQVRIIVATSAFGMGVDKSDVGLVIHYDISDSLENYVQEAGRAGRDPSLTARCYVLYSEGDLDRHFILLNQTKLSISDIQQVWTAVKRMTRQRERICCSALEIARQAGWDDSVMDIETRVRTALSALEQGGYLTRGNNVPHVYATGITVKNMDEARQRIMASPLFEKEEVEKAARIIKSLISQKQIAKAQEDEAESRIDYLADMLALSKKEVISAVERMRQEGILADTKDISAFLDGTNKLKTMQMLARFIALEGAVWSQINAANGLLRITSKQLNDTISTQTNIESNEKDIRTILNYLNTKEYIYKEENGAHNMEITRRTEQDAIKNRCEQRFAICKFAISWLYQLADNRKPEEAKKPLMFSVVELLKTIKANNTLFGNFSNLRIDDVEEALLYLSKIGALKLEGGFLVLYNAMDIHRVIKDNKVRYKQDDYRMLNEFYKQKIQQVHIVGEYANLMVSNYQAALNYVQDYFQMDYKRFVSKYFKGDRISEIERNVTPQKYQQIFGQLSDIQRQIIADKDSRCIVVAAGPGSGKTRVLVHKLASLMQLEDVKHEQMLMLTFSRAAATEFKQRLIQLSGNAAHFVEIKTFHSYSFDLLGRVGNLDDAQDVVLRAAEMINRGEVEPSRIGKAVLVIDEAQDMSASEFALVRALMDKNEDMRVIAVGDDDQNIYDFRGSDSGYLRQLAQMEGSRYVEMVDNYRSSRHVVDAANRFAHYISSRMKSAPIASVSENNGFVSVIRHQAKSLYYPLVNDLLQRRAGGSIAVLTRTNEEAVIVLALLKKHGVPSKLIQTTGKEFRFRDLIEVRYFLKLIKSGSSSPVLAPEVWEDAKNKTRTKYLGSASLPYVMRCIELFEATNRDRYLTDFREHVMESSIEDFADMSGCEVVVSTIHKSKGREFDDVYMMVSGTLDTSDKELRKYYVGMTRAKSRLLIHTNSSYFDGIAVDQLLVDPQQYDFPDEIVVPVNYRDVYLDYFKTRTEYTMTLRSGDLLTYKDAALYDKTGTCVAQLSKSKKDELQVWQERGYQVTSGSVRFVLAWRPKPRPETPDKQEKETAVILADLVLKKAE